MALSPFVLVFEDQSKDPKVFFPCGTQMKDVKEVRLLPNRTAEVTVYRRHPRNGEFEIECVDGEYVAATSTWTNRYVVASIYPAGPLDTVSGDPRIPGVGVEIDDPLAGAGERFLPRRIRRLRRRRYSGAPRQGSRVAAE